MASVRKLFVHFGQFLTGNALTLLLGLVTFPILTRVLSREEYGILGLVTSTVAIAVAFAKGGLSDGIIRFYRSYADDPQRLKIFTSTVLTRGVLLSAIVVGLYLFAVLEFGDAIGINPDFLSCFVVMAIYLFVRPLNIIVLNYLRALGKIFAFNITNVLTRTCGIILAFTFLFWLIGKLYGYFLGIALAEVGAMVLLYRWLLKDHRFSFTGISNTLAIDLLKFGIPLLLTELSYLLLSTVDRYMIIAYHGEDLLGLYSVGHALPSYINDVVLFSLSYAVVPLYTELYTREGRAPTEAFLSRATRYYLMCVIPLCAGYWAVSQDLITTLASAKYADAAAFSPFVLAGLVFLGLNSILYAGLYLEKKTTTMLAIMLSAVIVNVALNTVLIPRYGATGAALATLAACVLSTVQTAWLSFRHLRIHVPLGAIAYYTVAAIVMYGVLRAIDLDNALLNLAIRVPLGAVVYGTAVLLREAELRATIRKMIAGRSAGA